jgi:hypothetical protein
LHKRITSSVFLLFLLFWELPVSFTAGQQTVSRTLATASSKDRQSTSLPIVISSRVKVSPLSGGYYPWYQIAADPQDPHKLIVCGSMWNAKDNALYGFVYSSADGGESWRIAIEDKNSTWVSEQSCAFGINAKAYFVSEASKVIDGELHHFLGRTRVFVSNDAGQSWIEAAETKWADASSSVVDTNPGPDQNRLYTFFNYQPYTSDHDAIANSSGTGSGLGLLTFIDGNKEINGPIVSERISAGQRYAMPESGAFLLKNGKLITLYYTLSSVGGTTDNIIASVQTDTRRLSMSRPTLAASIQTGPEDPCSWRSLFASAYDSSRDRVYLAYRDERCRYALARSDDGGTTWSKGTEIPEPDTISHEYFAPAMAVDRDGTLGLVWRDNVVSDCWYFSASVDGGETFTSALALSQCAGPAAPSPVKSGAFLNSRGLISDLLKPEGMPSLGLSVVNYQNTVWGNNRALTASSDGAFHAAWIEVGNGEGQLRTATVTVGDSHQAKLTPLIFDERNASDITQDVRILYGGDQHYDISSGTLNIRVVLKNKSSQPLRAPVLLKAETLTSEAFQIEVANSNNGLTGRGAIWDLSPAIPQGVLNSGAASKPYLLRFHVQFRTTPTEGGFAEEFLSMRLKAFSSIPSLK